MIHWEKRRTQQISSYRAGYETGGGTGGCVSGASGERCGSVFNIFVALAGAALVLVGGTCWIWGLDHSNKWVKEGLKGNLWDQQEIGVGK